MTFDTKKLTLAEKKALLADLRWEKSELQQQIDRLAEEIRSESNGPTLWESLHELRS